MEPESLQELPVERLKLHQKEIPVNRIKAFIHKTR